MTIKFMLRHDKHRDGKSKINNIDHADGPNFYSLRIVKSVYICIHYMQVSICMYIFTYVRVYIVFFGTFCFYHRTKPKAPKNTMYTHIHKSIDTNRYMNIMYACIMSRFCIHAHKYYIHVCMHICVSDYNAC